MIDVRVVALTVSFLLLGLCLAGETACSGQTNAVNECRLVVTQSECRVFTKAVNRAVDRMRLSNAARKLIAGGVTNDMSVGAVVGLRVESVNYIGSNKVEAVFLVPR